MKLTNLFDLPQPIYDAVANDPYTKGDSDYSITGLLKPPRMARLQYLHDADMVEDCADRIFSLLGQAIHTILERSERVAIAEKRLYATLGGKRISGATDRFVLLVGLLQDYKVTTLWKIKGKDFEEWTAQQNAYLWLLSENGFHVRRLEIVAILRDWSKRKARTELEYPVNQCARIGLEIWPLERTKAFLLERITAHEAAKVDLPLCTKEDRWMGENTWAVMKPGGKRATKVCHSLDDAIHFCQKDDTLEIIERKAEAKRCLDFCSAAKFCDQFKSGA